MPIILGTFPIPDNDNIYKNTDNLSADKFSKLNKYKSFFPYFLKWHSTLVKSIFSKSNLLINLQ